MAFTKDVVCEPSLASWPAAVTAAMAATPAYAALEAEEAKEAPSGSEEATEEEPSGSWCSSGCICKACLGCTCLSLCHLGCAGACVWTHLPHAPALSACGQGYLEAYESGIAFMKESYAFTEWKKLDWQEIREAGLADARRARDAGSVELLHLGLRKAAASVPDGHVWMGFDGGVCGAGNEASRLERKEKADAIGGGFGMTISPLDDGSVILTSVTPDSQAARANLQAGQTVTSVDGVPIADAVGAMGLQGWMRAEINPATNAHRLTEGFRAIVRAPVGTSRKWTVNGQTVTLTAEADNYVTWDAMRYSMPQGDYTDTTTGPVKSRRLASGFGYIGIKEFPGALLGNPAQPFSDALAPLSNTPGLVLDMRGNFGGADNAGSASLGLFLPAGSEPFFYENVAFGPEYEVSTTLWVEPAAPFYTKPVVVLVNRGCISTGEGIPMVFGRLPRARSRVVGFEGTAASFGMAGAKVEFPGGFVLEYAYGRSLNEQKHVQLDSDSTLHGGNLPTSPIPLNSSNVIRFIQGQLNPGTVDVELEHAEVELRKMIAASHQSE